MTMRGIVRGLEVVIRIVNGKRVDRYRPEPNDGEPHREDSSGEESGPHGRPIGGLNRNTWPFCSLLLHSRDVRPLPIEPSQTHRHKPIAEILGSTNPE